LYANSSIKITLPVCRTRTPITNVAYPGTTNVKTPVIVVWDPNVTILDTARLVCHNNLKTRPGSARTVPSRKIRNCGTVVSISHPVDKVIAQKDTFVWEIGGTRNVRLTIP
jgi:hypothetical protein